MSGKVAKKTTKAKAKRVLHAEAKALAIHPLLAGLPVTDEVVARLAKDCKAPKGANGGQHKDKHGLRDETTESWASFAADIKKRGIKEPLVCIKDDKGKLLIVDGRHRFAAGKAVGLERFPYVLTQDEPSAYILGAVCHRYHWTKQQRAYFAVSIHPHVAKEGQGQRKDLTCQKLSSCGDLADEIGVSRGTVQLAVKLYNRIHSRPGFPAKYEYLIFGGMSLEGLWVKIELDLGNKQGGTHTDDAWSHVLDKLGRETKIWAAVDWAAVMAADEEKRSRVLEAVDTFAMALPEPMRAAMMERWKEGGE